MKYDLYIDRDFNLITDSGPVEVHLTSHLFKRRVIDNKKQSRYRAFMFAARWQYEDIIKAAFDDYSIGEYANSGRVAFIFKYHNNTTVGMLLDIRFSEDTYDVTIVTIDTLDDRHFIKSDMFCKESNKLYSDYELPTSYIGQVEKRIDRNNFYEIFYSKYFSTITNKTEYADIVDEVRLICSLVSRIKSKSIPYGTNWIKVEVSDGIFFYVRISAEKIWRTGEEKFAVVFIDIRRSKERAETIANRFGEKIYKISSEKYAFFGKQNMFQPRVENRGLRIKRSPKA